MKTLWIIIGAFALCQTATAQNARTLLDDSIKAKRTNDMVAAAKEVFKAKDDPVVLSRHKLMSTWVLSDHYWQIGDTNQAREHKKWQIEHAQPDSLYLINAIEQYTNRFGPLGTNVVVPAKLK